MDPENEFAYEAIALQCHACKAISTRSRAIAEADDTGRALDALSFTVKKRS